MGRAHQRSPGAAAQLAESAVLAVSQIGTAWPPRSLLLVASSGRSARCSVAPRSREEGSGSYVRAWLWAREAPPARAKAAHVSASNTQAAGAVRAAAVGGASSAARAVRSQWFVKARAARRSPPTPKLPPVVAPCAVVAGTSAGCTAHSSQWWQAGRGARHCARVDAVPASMAPRWRVALAAARGRDVALLGIAGLSPGRALAPGRNPAGKPVPSWFKIP